MLLISQYSLVDKRDKKLSQEEYCLIISLNKRTYFPEMLPEHTVCLIVQDDDNSWEVLDFFFCMKKKTQSHVFSPYQPKFTLSFLFLFQDSWQKACNRLGEPIHPFNSPLEGRTETASLAQLSPLFLCCGTGSKTVCCCSCSLKLQVITAYTTVVCTGRQCCLIFTCGNSFIRNITLNRTL